MINQQFLHIGDIYVMIDNISHVVDDGDSLRIILRQAEGGRTALTATGAGVEVLREWLDKNTECTAKKT